MHHDEQLNSFVQHHEISLLKAVDNYLTENSNIIHRTTVPVKHYMAGLHPFTPLSSGFSIVLKRTIVDAVLVSTSYSEVSIAR